MLARSIPGSARSPGGGHAVHFSILAWRIPRTEEGGLVRRVTKPGARFHMTDFVGGILSRADFCSQGLLGAPKICVEPSTTWSVGEGPSLRVAFGPQHPPPPHTHPYLAGCFALAESPQTVAGRPGAVAGRWLGARSPRTLLPGPSQLGLNEPHAPATTGAAPTSLFPQTLPGPLGAYLRGPHVQGLQVGRPKGPARSPTC